MTVVVNSAYESLREWIESVPALFSQSGEVIYDARNQIRLMRAPEGTEVCVKRFHKPRFFNRIGYTFFRDPKAQRAYENALHLLSKGIATPAPIGYILCGEGLLEESYLITLKSTLQRNFYEFGDGNITGKEDILLSFAHYTAKAHEAQIYHLDYSPGNILFDQIDGKWQFEMIDLNRLETHSRVDLQKGSSNFARLWGKEELHRIIVTEYAHTRGFDATRCLDIALHSREKFWRKRPHSFFVYD